MRLELHWHGEDGTRLPVALWRPGQGYRMISSAVIGGGIGPREWVLNAQVPGAYSRTDPGAHLTEAPPPALRAARRGSGAGLTCFAAVAHHRGRLSW